MLREALSAAVVAADAAAAVLPHLPPPPCGRTLVVGAGKAAAAMARSVEEAYGHGARLTGCVVTPYGHALPTERVAVVEAAHPVPDDAGAAATRRVMEHVTGAGEDDLVVCLLSGGGSALLCAPDGVTVAEKAATTAALLRAGADIGAINAVRKHLSRVKGGRLAAMTRAPLLTLAVSDVVGDDPSTIASGPTVADPTTFADAAAILARYAPEAAAARRAVEDGVRGLRPESPKHGDPRLARARYVLVASGATAVRAAADRLREAGVDVLAQDPLVTGDSTEAAARQAREVQAALARAGRGRPLAFVYGGETTVARAGFPDGAGVAAGPGPRGGPNGEWALAFAAAMAPERGFWLLAADTDGIDGDSTAAGALLGPEELGRLTSSAVAEALRRHDSHGLLGRVGGLLTTGPTRTNVNALRVVLFPPLPRGPS